MSNETTKLKLLPLAEELPLDEQYRALREGCALFDRSGFELLEMPGEDRERFLNGRVTCEVKGLEPGSGIYGFVTSAKGRVLADLSVLALDDRFWLVLAPGKGGEIRENFEKYVLADRVEMRLDEDLVSVGLAGPGAVDLLADLGEVPSQPRAHRKIEVGVQEARLVREVDLGVPTFSLWLPRVGAEEALEVLLAKGAVAVGEEAVEILRVEAGRPLFGQDFGPENFPQETGLDEEAVSYTKGCYLGQEVVARIHYRGGVNRHLRGLKLSAEAETGSELLLEGRAVGTLTSTVDSPREEGWIGLAILHDRAEPGAVLEVEGSGSTTVVELPFGSPEQVEA